MVKLEEVEDETFVEKPTSSKDGALLVDDDADYTDTGKKTSQLFCTLKDAKDWEHCDTM